MNRRCEPPVRAAGATARTAVQQVMGQRFSPCVVEISLFMPSLLSRADRQEGGRAAWTLCANGETHFNLAQNKMYKHDGIRIKGTIRTSTSSTSSASSGSTGA